MNLAVIVVSRNDPERTDALCERLMSLAKVPFDLFVVESGSDLDRMSKHASLWTRENINWVSGFCRGVEYAQAHKMRHAGKRYDAFWMICNDAMFPDEVLPEDRDPISAIHRAVEQAEDGYPWAVIHPYQKYFGPGHPGLPLNKTGSGLLRTSFVEFVCPIFNAEFLENCKAHWGFTPLLEEFTRGWGVDYLLSFMAGELNWAILNSNDFGVLHIPNTSHLNHLQTKTEDNHTFLHAARKEMLDVLVRRWGQDWGEKFLKAIPDLPDQCFRNWSVGDRELSKTWKVT